MKGTGILLIALMAGLLVVMAPHTMYAADRIELLVPAETAAVETGGTYWPVIEPFGRAYETGRINLVRPAESAEVGAEMGAGEVAGMLLTHPFECDNSRIESVCP